MPPFYISVKSSTAGVKRDHVRGKVSIIYAQQPPIAFIQIFKNQTLKG